MGENTGRFCFFERRLFILFTLVSVTVLSLTGSAPAGAQGFLLDPAFTVPSDFDFTVDIAIDCAGLEVKGVEIVLEYDPLLLQLNEITPGPWYTALGRDFYFFDYTEIASPGIAHFASSVLEGTNDQSLTIAVYHFTAQGFGLTPLVFVEVDVRDATNQVLDFGHSTGDLILIDPAVPVTDTSFGALKVLFR
jgi:hypothetical protein